MLRFVCRAALCFLLFYPAVHPAAGDASINVVYTANLVHASSPVWDGAMNRLHFVDTVGRRVLSYDPVKELCKDVQMEQEVASVVPYIRNRVLVPSSDRILQVDFAGRGERVPLHIAWLPASLEFCDEIQLSAGETGFTNRKGFSLRAAQCDPQGRLWVGYHRDPELRSSQANEVDEDTEEEEEEEAKYVEHEDEGTPRSSGVLFSLTAPPEWKGENDPDGILHQYGPNPVLKPRLRGARAVASMAWYKAEGAEGGGGGDAVFRVASEERVVERLAFDRSAGDINLASRQRVVDFSQLPEAAGCPRGVAVDSAGLLWVAADGHGRVVQVDPSSGAELHTVYLPGKHPTGCAFGGAELEHLYVTCRASESERGVSEKGCLLRVSVDGVRGHHAAWHFSDPEHRPPAPAKPGKGGKKGKGKGKQGGKAGQGVAAESVAGGEEEKAQGKREEEVVAAA